MKDTESGKKLTTVSTGETEQKITDEHHAEKKINSEIKNDEDVLKAQEQLNIKEEQNPDVATSTEVTEKQDTSDSMEKHEPQNSRPVERDFKLSVDLDNDKLNDLPEDIRDLLMNKRHSLLHKERNKLYQYAINEDANGNIDIALNIYLRCIRDLLDTDAFKSLPECLRKVAHIYYKNEEYEKAVQFIQAEKLYYESALVDIKGLRIGGDTEEVVEELIDDPFADNPDSKRAAEYENLARMCLQKGQPSLALEYQGKATKIRRKLYGEQHNITTDSLDFFTMIYAEVGKEQYSESMQKMSEPLMTTNNVESAQNTDGGTTLRKRKNKKSKTEASAVPNNTSQPPTETADKGEDMYVYQVLVGVLLAVCITVLIVLLFYLYCRLDPKSQGCVSVKADVHYAYMRFKYFIFKIYGMITRSDNTYG